jgi:hypothetical protein
VFGVGEQEVGNALFRLELPVRLDAVGADPENFDIETLEPRVGVSNRARLFGSGERLMVFSGSRSEVLRY